MQNKMYHYTISTITTFQDHTNKNNIHQSLIKLKLKNEQKVICFKFIVEINSLKYEKSYNE